MNFTLGAYLTYINIVFFSIGIERFNQYEGYASSFTWTGSYKDETPSDMYGRKMCTVLAIDASDVSRNPRAQYSFRAIQRELNKVCFLIWRVSVGEFVPASRRLLVQGRYSNIRHSNIIRIIFPFTGVRRVLVGLRRPVPTRQHCGHRQLGLRCVQGRRAAQSSSSTNGRWTSER